MKVNQARFVLSAVRPSHYPPADRPEIAFAGRSNVGKSSLLNTLVGRKRLAHVSRTPGRTQHINFFDINDAFYFVDLPGYGYAKVSKSVRSSWGPMIEAYLTKRETLCATVVLLDVRRDPSEEDLILLEGLRDLGVPIIGALTKCDKLSKSRILARRKTIAQQAQLNMKVLIPYSSLKSIGREALWGAIDESLEIFGGEM